MPDWTPPSDAVLTDTKQSGWTPPQDAIPTDAPSVDDNDTYASKLGATGQSFKDALDEVFQNAKQQVDKNVKATANNGGVFVEDNTQPDLSGIHPTQEQSNVKNNSTDVLDSRKQQVDIMQQKAIDTFKKEPELYNDPKNRDTYYNSLSDSGYHQNEINFIKGQDIEKPTDITGINQRINPINGQPQQVNEKISDSDPFGHIYQPAFQQMDVGWKQMKNTPYILTSQGQPAAILNAVDATTKMALGVIGLTPVGAGFNLAVEGAEKVAPQATERFMNPARTLYALVNSKIPGQIDPIEESDYDEKLANASDGAKAAVSLLNLLAVGVMLHQVGLGADELKNKAVEKWTPKDIAKGLDNYDQMTDEQKKQVAQAYAEKTVDEAQKNITPDEQALNNLKKDAAANPVIAPILQPKIDEKTHVVTDAHNDQAHNVVVDNHNSVIDDALNNPSLSKDTKEVLEKQKIEVPEQKAPIVNEKQSDAKLADTKKSEDDNGKGVEGSDENKQPIPSESSTGKSQEETAVTPETQKKILDIYKQKSALDDEWEKQHAILGQKFSLGQLSKEEYLKQHDELNNNIQKQRDKYSEQIAKLKESKTPAEKVSDKVSAKGEPTGKEGENKVLTNAPSGDTGETKFTKDKSVKYTYKLIEADQLQASHLPSGERNPNHTIARAQPKERNDTASLRAQDEIAKKPNFKEVSESPNAYFGTPIVNENGEVIQGNNRSIGLQKHYEKGGTQYKSDLAANAEKFGLKKEDVEGMKKPVLVREVKVDDEEAVRLGQHDVKDLETGGKQSIDPIATSRKMKPEDKSKLSAILFGGEGDKTIKETIRDNASKIGVILKGYINDAQHKNTFNADGTFTAKGMDAMSELATHLMFDGGDVVLPEVFNELPNNVQKGLQKALPHILSLDDKTSILPEVQNAMMAMYEFSKSGIKDFDGWSKLADLFKDGKMPKDIFTPLELRLADDLLKAKNQSDIKNIFAQYEDNVTGKPADMFNEKVDGLSKAEAIKKQFNIDYNEKDNENDGHIAPEKPVSNKKVEPKEDKNSPKQENKVAPSSDISPKETNDPIKPDKPDVAKDDKPNLKNIYTHPESEMSEEGKVNVNDKDNPELKNDKLTPDGKGEANQIDATKHNEIFVGENDRAAETLKNAKTNPDAKITETPLLNTLSGKEREGQPESKVNEKEWLKSKEGDEFKARMPETYKLMQNNPDAGFFTHSKVERAMKALSETDGKWTDETTKLFLESGEKKEVKLSDDEIWQQKVDAVNKKISDELRKARGELSMNKIPIGVIPHLLELAKLHIEKGVKSFIEAVRKNFPDLKDIKDDEFKNLFEKGQSEKEFEDKYDDPEMTKMANAIHDAYMDGKFGTDAIDHVLSKLQDTNLTKIYEAAKAKIKSGIIDVEKVRKRVMEQKRGSEQDQAVILYDAAELKGKEAAITDEINKTTDPAARAKLQNDLIKVQDDMMDNALANRAIGRSASTIFRLRQVWVDKSANLDQMMNEYQAAKGLDKLTKEQRDEVTAHYNKIRELEAKMNAVKAEDAKIREENLRLQKENEILKNLKESNKEQVKRDRGAKAADVIQRSRQRTENLKDKLRALRNNMNDATKVIPEAAVIIGKMAAEEVYRGATKLDVVVKNILDDIKDIFPDFTEKDIREHLEYTKPSKARSEESKILDRLKKAAQFEGKTERGDFTTKQRNIYEKSDKLRAAEKEYAKARFEWDKARRNDLMANRPMGEKIADNILRWQRFVVLSYPSTLLKLVTVVGHGLILKPLRFAINSLTYGVTKAISPTLADKQGVFAKPRLSSLAKYYGEWFRNFSLENLKEHLSGVDSKEMLHGKPFIYDEWKSSTGWMDMPGRTHGYVKSFIKNPEFEYANNQLNLHYIDKMNDLGDRIKEAVTPEEKEALQKEYDSYDVTKEDVQQRIGVLSLEHAKWSILMNDNKFVENMRHWMDRQNPFIRTLLKSELPIVKIPTNFVARAFMTKYGLIKAMTGTKWMGGETPSIINIIKNGASQLSDKEATLLGQAVAQGSMGVTFFALGYLLHNQVTQNDDGSYDVMGVHIPKILGHVPEYDSIFSGAKTGKLMSEKGQEGFLDFIHNTIKSDKEIVTKSPFFGMLKYGFIPNLAKAFMENKDDKVEDKISDAFAKKLSDMATPGFLKESAQWNDAKKGSRNIGNLGTGEKIDRKLSGGKLERFWQTFEEGIPGLRQNVPTKANESQSAHHTTNKNLKTKGAKIKTK